MNSLHRNGKTALFVGLCLSILLIASSPAIAQDRNWKYLLGANFSNGAYWSPTGAPSGLEDAIFDLSNPGLAYEVRLDASATIGAIHVLDDFFELNLYGNTLTLQDFSGMWVGKDFGEIGTIYIYNSQPSPGLLTGTCGGSGCSSIMLGWQAGSLGRLMINGNNTDVSNIGVMWIGDHGDGQLEMSGGATLTSNTSIYTASQAGSTGLVTVDDLGTFILGQNIGIGVGGSGVLNISGGGRGDGHPGHLYFLRPKRLGRLYCDRSKLGIKCR